MSVLVTAEVLTRNFEFVQLADAGMPAPWANSPVTMSKEAPGSGNALSMQHRVPAGVRGVSRISAASFFAEMLFGSTEQVTLVIDGLPFHGVGQHVRGAEEDLVASVEEALDELTADLSAGVELSQHLQRALEFAKHVFATSGGEC
jgi:hypothetical protein